METKKIGSWLWEFNQACIWSLTAINLGLRKGEAARASALKLDSAWAAEIEFWFELAVSSKPLFDELGPEVRAALVAALLAAIRETIAGAVKGSHR